MGKDYCVLRFGFSRAIFKQLIQSEQLLLSSADHYALRALTVAFVRRLMGKETKAVLIAAENLLFRLGPLQGFRGSLFWIGKKFRVIEALSITPFNLAPQNRRICSGWIFDPQVSASNLSGTEESLEEKTFLKEAAAQGRLSLIHI